MTIMRDNRTGIMRMDYCISDFGAIGDGETKNTQEIQSAIDTCSVDGGGKVVVPQGIFVTGTIVLKDNVELHLLNGATLLGSPDREDYDGSLNLEHDIGYPFENAGKEHLILAISAKNIALSGRGCIDGNAGAFLNLSPDAESVFTEWRPGQMVVFCGCENVTIRDLSFRNAPYWTIRPWACTSVIINGIRIDNNLRIPNGDGVDIDACKDVIVTGCIINAADDCITLRACSLIGLPREDCENIVVSDCVLSTDCSGVRVGVGNGAIRNARFSNLIIRNYEGYGY